MNECTNICFLGVGHAEESRTSTSLVFEL